MVDSPIGVDGCHFFACPTIYVSRSGLVSRIEGLN